MWWGLVKLWKGSGDGGPEADKGQGWLRAAGPMN